MKWEVLVWIDSYGRWCPIGSGQLYATRGWALCYAAIMNTYASGKSNYVYRVFPHDGF